MEGDLSFSPYLIILVCLEIKVQHVFDIVPLMPKIWSLSNSDSRSVSYHAQQNIWSNLTLGNIMEFREYLDLALKHCRILWKSSLNLPLHNKGVAIIYIQSAKSTNLLFQLFLFFFSFGMQFDWPALVQMLMKCKKYRVIVTKRFCLVRPALRHSCLNELVTESH